MTRRYIPRRKNGKFKKKTSSLKFLIILVLALCAVFFIANQDGGDNPLDSMKAKAASEFTEDVPHGCNVEDDESTDFEIHKDADRLEIKW